MDSLPKLSAMMLPWPTDWQDVFKRDVPRPLILDIGFGYGHTLKHLHKTHPEADIVGVEIDNSCMTRAEKFIQRDQMHNVRVVRSRAETTLHHLFTPDSLSEVHVNFPDPWFKTRHGGRRLMQRDTLDTIVNRLKPDGMFYLATDIREYAEMSAELLAATAGLTNNFETPWVHELPGRTITKYERKAIEVGRTCYYFAYRRNQQPALDIPVQKEKTMLHMIIQTPLSLEEMMQRFEKQRYAHDDIRVKLMNCYRNERALLFEVFVYEATIEQRLAIMLVQREDGDQEFALKLSVLGLPRTTDGVHFAVDMVGKMVVSMHPDARIIQDRIKHIEMEE